MKITKQLTKKYCHFVVFSLALALAAPFLSCGSGGGGDGDGDKDPGEVPSVPQNFTATASSRQVTLTWDVLSGLTYDLYYSTTQGFDLESGTEIAGVTQPYTHTGLTNDTTYYYRLTATNASGTSEPTDEVSAITPPATPIAILYQAVDGATTTFQGDFGGKGFGLCDEANAPALFKASEGYTGHTFYGSTNATTHGSFTQLPQRLGGDNPGDRPMRLWRAMTPMIVHTPTVTTTLSELIALSGADYVNTAKIKPIFQWMEHGDETMANSFYRYWSFTNASGEYDSASSQDGTCTNASTNMENGITGKHNNSDHKISGGLLPSLLKNSFF